ncbi:MAG: glycosyltransferase family 2 protein [Paracoccaceae bacterium]
MIILAATPDAFHRNRAHLTALFGPRIRPLPCPRPRIEAALLAHGGPALVQAAEQRPPAIQSCRSLDRIGLALWTFGLAVAAIMVALLRPDLAFTLLILGALASFAALFALKLAAAWASRHPIPEARPLPEEALPVISVLIALYGEDTIAPRLIHRLSALDYPRDRLDVILLLEACDHPTRRALSRMDLPGWMRVVTVPDGTIRTKPRALNYGLDLARGGLIGIYDAEDAPAPDQLRKVAAHFAAAPPRLACLQGMLDFYNPATNWIARCFTFEYAAWFRLVLPGLARLGLPLPLGGTTLFLRRDALLQVGGWDAHNVTEDCDLGLRLARSGWYTDILPSTTMEEANCRAIPWIRQRSRWTKGYLMTWIVHMRAPRQLWRDLGAAGFLGMQALILGSLLQGVANPALWSLWLVPFGMAHPLGGILPPAGLHLLALVLLLAQLADFALVALAMRRSPNRLSLLWLPLLKPYALLASFAAAKALVEAIARPFHWDKTKHGHFDTAADPLPRNLPDTVPVAALSASGSRPHPPAGASRRPC